MLNKKKVLLKIFVLYIVLGIIDVQFYITIKF
jgi:hypothetical protein